MRIEDTPLSLKSELSGSRLSLYFCDFGKRLGLERRIWSRFDISDLRNVRGNHPRSFLNVEFVADVC